MNPKPPARPCGSCPYRKDVPSGIWDVSEYVKLPAYDGDITNQVVKGAFGLFMCHQRDGCLCGGWLQSHGTDDLLALRLNSVDPSAWNYTSEIEVFGSGAAAALHGLQDIADPSPEARRFMDGITKAKGKDDG